MYWSSQGFAFETPGKHGSSRSGIVWTRGRHAARPEGDDGRLAGLSASDADNDAAASTAPSGSREVRRARRSRRSPRRSGIAPAARRHRSREPATRRCRGRFAAYTDLVPLRRRDGRKRRAPQRPVAPRQRRSRTQSRRQTARARLTGTAALRPWQPTELRPGTAAQDGGRAAAVPIDIQHIDAALTFDGATSSGSGDATLDFVVGPTGGCPIFDLRQTITAAWLDGAPLAVAQVAPPRLRRRPRCRAAGRRQRSSPPDHPYACA